MRVTSPGRSVGGSSAGGLELFRELKLLHRFFPAELGNASAYSLPAQQLLGLIW